MNKLSIIDKIQLHPLCKQHCSHYTLKNNNDTEDTEYFKYINDIDTSNLCTEEELLRYIHNEVVCKTCKKKLLLTIPSLNNKFYEFNGLKDVRSEDSINCNDIHLNLEYLFTNYKTRLILPFETKVDFSTDRYRQSLVGCFLQLEELLRCEEITEEVVLKQDELIYEILQIIIRFVHTIHKYVNVTIFETSHVPTELHTKLWKLIDLLYGLLYQNIGVFSRTLCSFLEELSMPLYPLLNIHTPHYFEEFKKKCGNDPDAIHKVLMIKKSLNLTRCSDLMTFYRSIEKHLLKYENDFVNLMNQTCVFHDSEEYIGAISFSCDTSILFVLFEYVFGPLLSIDKNQVLMLEQELQMIDLRAYQVITNQHTSLNKVRDRLNQNIIPYDFALIPEYRNEIYNVMKKFDAEVQFHQQIYERQQKYEDELEKTGRKKKNNYSSRVFYGISIIKFFSVIRKISVFTHFLNETKYLLEGLVCDGLETHVMDYLEIIKYDIQIEKITERCKSFEQQRFYDELLLNDDIASKTPKKKSKKKSKSKEKNNNKKMESPTSEVPEKLEWISKVNPSESTNSLVALMEDTTSSDSSDGERWTHVNSTNSTKKKNKATKILQKNNNNVAAVKKNVTSINEKNVKVITIPQSNNVKQGLSFAQALLKNKQPEEEAVNVSKSTDVVQEVTKNTEVVVQEATTNNNITDVVQEVTKNIEVVVQEATTNNNTTDVVQEVTKNTEVVQDAIIFTSEKTKKQKQKKKNQQPPPPPPPPPPPMNYTIPTTLPSNRELTSERYFSRIPNYIHIPTYTPQNFYVPHDPNPKIPMIQQQPLLIPTIAYVPQMYSTPYHIMYPTSFY